jgi:DNA-directed RNA polymerase beta' subunit
VVIDAKGEYTKANELVLDTEGTNLLAVMSHPDVDHTRTTSNNVIEIIEVLGIEAVRNALLRVRPYPYSFLSFDISFLISLFSYSRSCVT